MTIRVLVVDDSRTVCQHLTEVLSADPELQVIGEAQDGRRAIELCAALRPDVMTLDMMLPIMSGLAATEYVMAHCPTPILIVSSSFNRGELFKTYDALAAGAVDTMEKPRGDEPEGEWERRFCETVKLVSRIKVITHPRARLGALGRLTPSPTLHEPPPILARAPHLVAIGASTGGPAAIVEILHALPAGFPIPLVVAMHIDETFGTAFAEWLDGQSHHRVAFAREGEPVATYTGRVAIAMPGRHLIVRGKAFHLTSDPPRHSCRPSIDLLFEALARDYGPEVTACLLTGMGRDGAAGLAAIRKAGGHTIAQDEATSVVYGMPREAVLLGAAAQVLSLGAIGRLLATLAIGVERSRA